MRPRILATVFCLCIGSVSAATEAERIIRQPTNIAPQDLAQALQILVKDRKIQIVYRSELVSDRRTQGVDGVLTLDEALTQLLRGSGLVYRYLDDNAITLVQEK